MTSQPTPLDTSSIRAMADAATEGPWSENGVAQTLLEADVRRPLTREQAAKDAKFIAASRTLVPALCDGIDARDKEIERLRAALASEREACAALCERQKIDAYDAFELGINDGCATCAAAIRARKEDSNA